MSKASYAFGHHSAVLSSHQWRTVENSAAYVIPYLRPSAELLDIGCGPGTITLDFASRLSEGHVTGLDIGASVIDQAKSSAKEQGITNVNFITGNIFDLEACGLEGKSFDIVHAHQTITHIPDRLGALKAMRGLLRPGGILAIRDADLSSFRHNPHFPEIDRYHQILSEYVSGAGGHPAGARELLSLAMAAGFARDEIKLSLGTWCYSTEEERRWWANTHARRLTDTGMRQHAKNFSNATDDDIERIAAGWRKWAECEDGVWAAMHFEIVAERS